MTAESPYDPIPLPKRLKAEALQRLSDDLQELQGPDRNWVLRGLIGARDLRRATNVLNDRQITILCLRFGLHDDLPRSYEEIATHLHIKSQRAAQLTRAVIIKLGWELAGYRTMHG